MSTEAEVIESTALVVRERSSVLLAPVMDVNTALVRLEEFQQFCKNYLVESKDGGMDGGDYGTIPGAGKKKVLFKSGADKLCELFGLADTYAIDKTIDWEKGLFDYEVTCTLVSRRDDSLVGSGLGCCSSFEAKYRWREAKRVCPQCGKDTIIKGKAEYGGGYICWKKEGRSDGCGAKFKEGDKSIETQVLGRVENPDIIDIKNTVLKIAKKRAKIDAVIGATRSSGIFSQDLDDLPPLQPSKPEPATTTEDIELGSVKGNRASAGPEKGSAPAPEPKQRETDVAYCGKAENTSFYAEIRKALPDELKPLTEDWGRAFLKDKGYTKKAGDKTEGSLKNVEKAMFKELLLEAVGLAGKVAQAR